MCAENQGTQQQPEKEKICAFWQKPCSEAHVDCNFWVTVHKTVIGPLGNIKNEKDSLCLMFAIFHTASTPKFVGGSPPGGSPPAAAR